MKTVFHLVRHADHGHVGKILTGRMAGIVLSQTGRAQARALARHMADSRVDALFSSPQPRARQTAEMLSSFLDIEARTSPDLDEIDFGRWEGQTFAALEDDPAWRRWNRERDAAATPAGETMKDVAARATAFLEGLYRQFAGGVVLLVSHSDVIRAVICHYLGRPFQDVHAIEISPASLTTLLFGSHGGEIRAINDCDHLAGEVVQ